MMLCKNEEDIFKTQFIRGLIIVFSFIKNTPLSSILGCINVRSISSELAK